MAMIKLCVYANTHKTRVNWSCQTSMSHIAPKQISMAMVIDIVRVVLRPRRPCQTQTSYVSSALLARVRIWLTHTVAPPNDVPVCGVCVGCHAGCRGCMAVELRAASHTIFYVNANANEHFCMHLRETESVCMVLELGVAADVDGASLPF